MTVTEELESLILNKDSATIIEEHAIKNGMITIVQDALIKAIM
jgi:type II secretory ATPase GspE/PulE/Tfp pilus assembly ATPase PilB-like protein